MYFLYRKNYEKCLDGDCRGDLTSPLAHNMLWSAFHVSPPSSVIQIQNLSLYFRGAAAILCSMFSLRIIRERP